MGARRDAANGPPASLDGNDLRTLLRLWDRLHAPGLAPSQRKRELLSGLCGMLRAYAAASEVRLVDPRTGYPEVVSVVRVSAGGKGLPRRARLPWHGAGSSPPPAGLGDVRPLACYLDLQHDPHLMASLTLWRRSGGGSSAARDVAVLDLVHREAHWLYASDRALASPGVRALPPRQRHVLQYLLAGEPESDVATWLGVGVQIVRSDLKAAWASLGAADREALHVL